MADEAFSMLLALAVAAGIAFGILAMCPRSRNGLLFATVANLCVFTVLSALGSALVGPLDLSQMLILAPFSILCAIVWFHWKVKT